MAVPVKTQVQGLILKPSFNKGLVYPTERADNEKQLFFVFELVNELYSVIVTQHNSYGISGCSLISIDNVHFDIIKKKNFSQT